MLLRSRRSLLFAGGSVRDAKAQFAVIDPANLVENIISALQNVQTVLNQVTQISHEVQSLAYQAQNLQKLPASVSNNVLGQYTTQFASLVAAMGSINGIAHNRLRRSQRNTTRPIPNTALALGPLSNANINSQLTAWLNQSRSVYQGAYNTQAQVISSLQADSANVQTLLQTSGSSQGALDAIQAGNQLSGQVAAQLMKINSQMATTNQAQMNWIAQQTQMIAQAQKISQGLASGYSNAGSPVVNLSYDRFH